MNCQISEGGLSVRVLWVVNVVLPELAQLIGYGKTNQGGWLPSLRGALTRIAPDVDLHICCAGERKAYYKIDGVSYYVLGRARKRFPPFGFSSSFIKAMTSVVKKVNPDLIHFHGSEGLFRAVPRKSYTGVRSVVSLQGILQGCYPHYTAGINELEIRRHRNYLNVLLTRYTVTRGAECWRARMGEREKTALSKAENILGRTEWDKAWAEYLAPQAKYFHVGEILRTEFYCGMRDGKEVRRHSIFCGGAMAYPLKGGHWLLRAVAALKRKFPDVQLRVANAARVRPQGTVANWLRRNEYQRYLWQIIKDNDLENNVVLMPSLTAEQVADELRKAEIFCLPSMCENSPNSIGEAMMLGTPVVATDVGGVSSVIDSGKEGILVPSGDPAVLATAISSLFMAPERAKGFADTAYMTARTRYEPKSVVRQLLETYEYIVDGVR